MKQVLPKAGLWAKSVAVQRPSPSPVHLAKCREIRESGTLLVLPVQARVCWKNSPLHHLALLPVSVDVGLEGICHLWDEPKENSSRL